MKNVIDIAIIPAHIIGIAKKLNENGFQAYLVGGAVRDTILGKEPKDYDIATDATPEQMSNLFNKVITTGAKFGNLIVITENEKNEKVDVDVTTFRQEENYFGGRWPNKVVFTPNIKDDLSRRDFTINSIAINLQVLIQRKHLEMAELTDPFNGISDIRDRRIKAVGNPKDRFGEDGLRAYKACRLASELSFEIEEKTLKAIYETRHVASQISKERIRDEFKKLIQYSPLPSLGIKYLDKTGLLKLIIPELVLTKNLTQPQWHENDVYTHSLKCVDEAEDEIKYSALFHDIGKTKTITIENNEVHFYNHAEIGANITSTLLKRLNFEKKKIYDIKNLINWHMFYFDFNNPNSEIGKKGIRNFVRKVGGINEVSKLLKLRIADGSTTHGDFDPEEIDKLQQKINNTLLENTTIQEKDLNIKGSDLINLGYPKGPMISKILNELLTITNQKPETNTYHNLVEIAKQQFPLPN